MTAFLAKFYEAVIVVLAAFLILTIIGLGIQSCSVSHYQTEYTLLGAKYKTELAETNAETEKAIADAAVKEKMAQKLLDAEIDYNAQIKQITVDARAADSLSKQLAQAKNVRPQLPVKPSLNTSIPVQTYSSSALLNIESWQKQLMDTQLMQND